MIKNQFQTWIFYSSLNWFKSRPWIFDQKMTSNDLSWSKNRFLTSVFDLSQNWFKSRQCPLGNVLKWPLVTKKQFFLSQFFDLRIDWNSVKCLFRSKIIRNEFSTRKWPFIAKNQFCDLNLFVLRNVTKWIENDHSLPPVCNLLTLSGHF